MKRRKAREYALQFLFQFDFTNKTQTLDNFREFWADKEMDINSKRFAESVIVGTLQNLETIDSLIANAAEHWVLDRMSAVDRNIIRCAVYEIIFREDIPSAVAINESLEIAKKFSGKDAASFINGVLDRIAKNRKK